MAAAKTIDDLRPFMEPEQQKEMDAAMQWAIAAPYPSPDEVTEDVYA